MIKKRIYKKGAIALSQILILILGTIAISYIIGIGQVPVVSADLCTSKCAQGQGNVVPSNCLSDCYSRYLCSDVGGTSCSQTCSGSTVQTLSGSCCLGSCTSPTQTQQSSSGGTAGTSYATCTLGSSACSAIYPGQAGAAATSTSTTGPGTGIDGAGLETAAATLGSTPKPADNLGGYSATNTQCPCTEGYDCIAGACVPTGTTLPYSPTENVPEAGGAAAATPTDWLAIGGKIITVIKDIAINAGISALVYLATGWIKSSLLGIKPGSQWNYVATGVQFLATGATFGALEMGSLTTTFPAITGTLGTFWSSAIGGGIIGAGLALIAFFAFYKTTKTDWVVVNCIPWTAPEGGNDCSKCGVNGLPCTAYQCTSLGQACQLENGQAGQGKPICIWVDPNDVTPPLMTFLYSALQSGYTATPVSPPAQYPEDTGVLIQSNVNGGKIPAFGSLTFGITTDKPSTCKIDTVRQSYSNLSFTMFGGIDGTEGLVGYNHTVSIPIFQPSSAGASVQTSGLNNIYISCDSVNGAKDPNVFDVQFVVDTTPDKTAPLIMGESIVNGAPVSYGTTSESVNVYVSDETGVTSPGGCSWSHNNYAYANMENNMTCGNNVNLQGTYAGTFTCNANLTGIKNGVENDFYFACSDPLGNVDTSAVEYTLFGTQPLVISSVTPTNGSTVVDSTQSVHVSLGVQTNAGQNQGMATCYYSPTGNGQDWQQFSNTLSYQSSQDLYLPAGAYTYYVKCVDLGGNAAYSSVNFNVQTQTQPPNVVRASHDGANLDIQTDENATCVYDIIDCTYPFSGGTSMSTSDGITQSTAWVAGETYYIKCQDSFGNQPAPDSCSIVLSASQS